MPTRPPRPCPACHTLTTNRGRCTDCERTWQAARNRQRAGRYTHTYRTNRARLLADHPPCHWCGRPDADTADHIAGNDPTQLVPACRSCNSARTTRPTNETLNRSATNP